MCSFGGGDYSSSTPEISTTPTPTAVTGAGNGDSSERSTINSQRRKKGARSTTLSTDRSSLVSDAVNGSRSTLG